MSRLKQTNVGSLKQLVEIAHDRQSRAKNKKRDLVFRGMRDAHWQLEPSLHRFVKRKLQISKFGNKQERELREIECDIYYLFSSRMAAQLGEDKSGWDYLFHMQHYAIPTRLLDWSDSPGKALWFACSPKESLALGTGTAALPALWILDIEKLNLESWESEDSVDPINLSVGDFDYRDIVANYKDFGFDLPVVIYPNYVNDRMRAQSGLFTVFGNNTPPWTSRCRDASKNWNYRPPACKKLNPCSDFLGTTITRCSRTSRDWSTTSKTSCNPELYRAKEAKWRQKREAKERQKQRQKSKP